jgi:DivIVA domain-containing protein
VDWKDLDRLRNPGFGFGRRGYDRHEVDRFLEQLVDWLETDAARDLGHIAITRKLELVGKSTTHVLLAAEQEAEELLSQAEADIAELRRQAQDDAGAVRAAADEYAAKTREEANAEASETIEEGLRRRARIDDEIKELDARRDAALERMEQLRTELAATMEGHRPAPAPETPDNGAKIGAPSGPKT